MDDQLFYWAHRGASAVAPENTMAAFQTAVEQGADGIELDVHLSRDGIPVVLHDETLERTTNGCGLVSRWPCSALLELDAGGWFSTGFSGERIPTLSDVLQVFAFRTKINIELKAVSAGRAVLQLLTHFPQADVVVSSFNAPLLKKMRDLDPGLPLAVLIDQDNWRSALDLAQRIEAVAVHPAGALAHRLLLAVCREKALPVHVWTVDDPGEAASLQRLGVCGVFTNDPARLRCEMPRWFSPLS